MRIPDTHDADQRVVFPNIDPSIVADDGNDWVFCSTCAFSEVCLAQGMGKGDLRELHLLVEHTGPYEPGQFLFREGTEFNSIAAVRAGTVKTFMVDAQGREQVLGFHLPGEVIGLNAIDGDRYPCDAVALDTVMLCRFYFPKIAMLATRVPKLQQQLFRLMSRDIGNAARFSGDYSADERVAAFIVGFSRRLAARGFSPLRFRLTMSRADLANYLRQAPETISRVLRRFEQDKLLAVRRRDVEIMDLPRLESLAAVVLRT
ncbi:MAG TPA: helix-turn-helix domain-containing protein [Chiayiivirga sp.]|nr:helix-turn-helix domain-containing protein [Chiayiivirga sp.]